MKKIISSVMICLLLLGASACGEKSTDNSMNDDSQSIGGDIMEETDKMGEDIKEDADKMKEDMSDMTDDMVENGTVEDK